MKQTETHLNTPVIVVACVIIAAIIMALICPEVNAIALGLCVYFLPAIVGRAKRNSMAIFLLNLLLGWTLVGWVIALVWAACKDRPDA